MNVVYHNTITKRATTRTAFAIGSHDTTIMMLCTWFPRFLNGSSVLTLPQGSWPVSGAPSPAVGSVANACQNRGTVPAALFVSPKMFDCRGVPQYFSRKGRSSMMMMMTMMFYHYQQLIFLQSIARGHCRGYSKKSSSMGESKQNNTCTAVPVHKGSGTLAA